MKQCGRIRKEGYKKPMHRGRNRKERREGQKRRDQNGKKKARGRQDRRKKKEQVIKKETREGKDVCSEGKNQEQRKKVALFCFFQSFAHLKNEGKIQS